MTFRTFTTTRSQVARSAIGAITGLALLMPSFAYADLMLYPTRVVMTGNQRSAQVEIVNRGDKPETYRINIVNRRMSETGEIVTADKTEAGELFADNMVVYTPRQVTLQPGQSQTVRVSVRKPAGLAEGEYRSHLQFDRVADATAASDLEATAKPEKGQVAIVLQALIGASIPVIIRQGQTSATVTLGELAVIPAKGDTPPALGFAFHRKGNQSVYGDVTVTFAPTKGKAVDVGKVAGVAVYVPNDIRKAQIPLTLPKGMALQGGSLTLRYHERADAGGKLMAEANIILP
ncbi:fimbrial biogenesis chaperone [Aquisediminimonas sediminicola]|uniref:fimbrial biogenesis chaperone n=1 Tax=Alteraquisediminimonas sediminicola TaxID=2676787 RepID=UPI001C8DF6BD|nr:Fn3-like domain-containing protein [Aquisediminimonas sediminicola]